MNLLAGNCKNCGAELFEGQQFCRSCGTPTGETRGAESPTQIFGAGQTPPDAPAGTDTSLLSGGETDAVYPPRSTGYQPRAVQPIHPVQPTNALPPLNVAGKSRKWIVAFLIIALMGAATLAALLMGVAARRRVVRQIVIHQPHRPPRPPALPQGTKSEEDQGMIGEEDADISGSESAITKTFELDEGASIALKNTSGEIHIEGWDESEAEVRITKHGGSEDERRAVRVTNASTSDRLALTSAVPSDSDVEVRYEIKLPRKVRGLEISANKSDVELSGVATESLSIDVQRGDIKLEDVGGSVNAKIIKGSAKITFSDAGAGDRREPNSFTLISGNLELRLNPETNADLKAEVIDGEIEADDDLGLTVEKRLVGKHLAGRVGAGGKPIVVKVIKGNVRIKR